MPLRNAQRARRYNDLVTLTRSAVTYDEFGHPSFAAATPVLDIMAEVRQMSATKSMMTFQQADAIGVDLEFRNPGVAFNGCTWHGHAIHFPQPENVDNRGRILKVSGWYQIDDPVQAAPLTPTPEPEEDE